MRTPLFRSLAFVALVATGACGGNDDGSERVADPGADRTVEMRLIQYRPERIEISAGDTVRWKQNDAGFHTVTSGEVAQTAAGVRAEPDGKFESGQIATGDTFEFAFEEAGTFAYFCAVHPATMRGRVIVA